MTNAGSEASWLLKQKVDFYGAFGYAESMTETTIVPVGYKLRAPESSMT